MEPIYTFKKGEGWVIQRFETFEAVMECGTRVRIERRKPNPGELCIWHYPGCDISYWENWVKNNRYTCLQPLEQWWTSGKGHDWIVAIKL